MEELHISDQGIEELSGVEELVSNPLNFHFKYLLTSYCLFYIFFQAKLTIIDASANSISTVPDLSQLSDLEDLWINDNKITDWKEVDKLAKIPSLSTIYLERNPIYKDDMTGYRRKVMLALEQVKQIDATACRT